MNIRVDLNHTIKDGSEIVFRSPVDCSAITGLVVYYVAEDGSAASREFVLTDAHGNDVGDIDHLFSENVVVKVILDVTAGKAYVLNADTNAYIESSFIKKTNGTAEIFTVTELGVQDHTGNCKFYAYFEEEITDENGIPTGQVFSFYGAERDEPVVLRGVHDPVMNHDAATKRYVDRKVAEVGNGSGQNPNQGAGLTPAARNLLINILRNGVYTSDQSANITALESALASAGGATPRNAFLYHFDGNLESSGLKSLGIAAVAPNYSDTAKFGKSAYVDSQNAVPFATGMSDESTPKLDGDFTIQFWAKLKTNTGFLFMAQKHMGTATAEYFHVNSEITVHNADYQAVTYNNGNAKYAGLSVFIEGSVIRIRVFSKDLSKASLLYVKRVDGNHVVGTDWHLYTMCRKDSGLMFYLDGEKIFTAPIPGELFFPDQISIGTGFQENSADTATTPNYSHTNNPIYMDELLIDDTTCWYTEDFTPNTSPYSDTE